MATWQLAGDSPGITAAVGDGGIEWRVDLSQLTGSQIAIIRTEAVDCASACQRLDDIDDGYVDPP